MNLYNIADPTYVRSLKDAVLQSLAPNKGLYMPTVIPALDQTFIQSLSDLSFQEISFHIAKNLIGEAISDKDLKSIIDRAINFPAPLSPVGDDIYSLELWHGPSLAFKDFGARFMAELMFYFTKEENKKLTILVATSGDTGGAVASGFLNVPNTEVIILYPSGKVSDLQEKQLTALGGNIFACEVDGTFDDCQALVKEAFSDESLSTKYMLSSANSINIARLIPQSFYYFEAYKQLPKNGKKVVYSVPSGNFGNLTAGLIAWKMGLPIDHFIAATNINKVVPDYLESGIYESKTSKATISNAMDVGNPSNFVRLQEIFCRDYQNVKTMISGSYYTDRETKDEMCNVYLMSGYVCDPHGAIGHRALREFVELNSEYHGVFLETAHPAKFEEVVNETLNIQIHIPSRLAELAQKQKVAVQLKPDYPLFKDYLLSR